MAGRISPSTRRVDGVRFFGLGTGESKDYDSSNLRCHGTQKSLVSAGLANRRGLRLRCHADLKHFFRLGRGGIERRRIDATKCHGNIESRPIERVGLRDAPVFSRRSRDGLLSAASRGVARSVSRFESRPGSGWRSPARVSETTFIDDGIAKLSLRNESSSGTVTHHTTTGWRRMKLNSHCEIQEKREKNRVVVVTEIEAESKERGKTSPIFRSFWPNTRFLARELKRGRGSANSVGIAFSPFLFCVARFAQNSLKTENRRLPV